MSKVLTANEPENNQNQSNSISANQSASTRDKLIQRNRTASVHESHILPELPSLKSKRYTTMGKGNRTDFSKLHKNVCQQFYDLPSSFNVKKPIGTAFSFGISRDYYKKVFCETNKSFDNSSPGPGNYEITKKLGSDAPKFSFYPKIENKEFSNPHGKKIPGPGEYKQIAINPNGKFPVSNIANVTNIIFGLNKDQRFKYKYSDIPAPGKYEVKSEFDGTGRFFLSKFKSSGAKSITGRIAEKPKRFQTPGPGQYSTYSDFGNIPSSRGFGSLSPSKK